MSDKSYVRRSVSPLNMSMSIVLTILMYIVSQSFKCGHINSFGTVS